MLDMKFCRKYTKTSERSRMQHSFKTMQEGAGAMEQGQDTFQAEDFYRLADVALEIIIRFSNTGNILYGNKQAREDLGYGEELKNISLFTLFPAELQQEEWEAKAFLDKMASMREGMMYRKNGTCFPVRMTTVVGEDYSLIFAINVAKRVETERKLVRMK